MSGNPPTSWKTKVERTVELQDHRRQELILTADGHPALPVHLLVPTARSAKRRPAVLALHGHGKFAYDPIVGKIEPPEVAEEIEQLNYDYGLQLMRRGYVVAAPCLIPFGRRLGDRNAYHGQDPCAVTLVRMQMLGKLPTVRVGNAVRYSPLPDLPSLNLGSDYLLFATAPSAIGLSTTLGLGQGRFDLLKKSEDDLQAVNGFNNLGLFKGTRTASFAIGGPHLPVSGPVSYSLLAGQIRAELAR